MKLVNRDINLNNYVFFYTVAKLKSFTLASNELFVSQPAVSAAIKQLEESLSVKLIYRDKGVVSLTKVGENVLKYVEAGLNNFNMIEENVINYKNLGMGTICVGVPAHIHNSFLFNYVNTFMKKYPNVEIKFETGNINSLIEKLQIHEIDFIVDEYPNDCKYNNIKVLKLHEYSKGFIFNKEYYPELLNKSFDISILEKYRLILPLKENSYRKELDSILYKKKITNVHTIEVNNTSQMYKYVENGLGLGYLITDLVENKEKYGILDLKDVSLKYNLCLMYIEGYASIMSKKLFSFILEMSKNEESVR